MVYDRIPITCPDPIMSDEGYDKIEKGAFLCGGEASLCDLSLGPKLYHLKTTLGHFYPDKTSKVRWNISKTGKLRNERLV